MRRASAQIVDALPELGGQLTALYPEKLHLRRRRLSEGAGEGARASRSPSRRAQFGEPVHLGQRVDGLEEEDGHFVLVTDKARFPSRAIVIAAGIGAFSPRRLPQECAQPWYGRGIHDVVTDPETFRGKRVVIIGGGDSAFDWATQLLERAARVTIVHRSDRFRAHAATVAQYHDGGGGGPRGSVHVPRAARHQVRRDRRRFHARRDARREIEGDARWSHADAIMPMLGFVSDLGALAEWGLTLEKKREIVVNSMMETGRPGIYAAGDITTYPGKLKLIATGFAEAATAVNQAVHWIYPEQKVAPGHSSNMEMFGQKDD